MSEANSTSSAAALGEIIFRLAALLTEETEALRSLDHEMLDSISARKLSLLSEVESISHADASESTIRALRSLRQQALMNQVLMVHARDLAQGLISTMTMRPTQGGGRLLHVRG
jgi:hypothetical protein